MSNVSILAATTPNNSAVFLKDGQVKTTSEYIARIFKKEHRNVIQAIENLDCSANFRALNFQHTHEKRNIGVAPRQFAYYEITRDGFVFLCMGFTGEKAAAYKELYIKRFNEMEAKLREQTAPSNSMFSNLKEGRYLLHIRNGETLIRDINTCSIIDTQVTEQVVRDLIKVQKANAEMVNRLAILSGCASKTLLENPIDIQISQGNFKPLQHSIDVVEPEPIVQQPQAAPQPLPETKPDINLIRKDRVALAKAFLNVVGQHGDGYRLARELGVHQSTGHKIMTSLYRIGNRDVYDDVS